MTRDYDVTQRLGRAPTTTHGELSHIALALFFERGFDRTTVSDIADAAGISRRTFFRYFRSKNDLPWGDFDGLLDAMRTSFASHDRELPLIRALQQTIVDFNRYPDEELPFLRSRMDLLLNVPSLSTHSTLRYAAWRRVIAECIAARRGEHIDAIAPQSIAWACLGLTLSAYEQWLAREDADLLELLDSSFSTAESVFGGLD